MTFTATHENTGVVSRTCIDGVDGTNSVKWQSDDAIAVYDGTTTNSFSVASGAGTTSATLSGEVTSGSTSFSAVYPYSAVELSGGAIYDIVIPDVQTATESTYDPAAAVMTATATSTDNNFAFKNACSFLKITPSAAYLKISISVTSGTLAGTFTCSDYSSATLSVMSGYGKKMIVLNPASGSTTIAANKSYFIAVAPGTISGLSIKCYTSASEYYELVSASGKSFTFVRSKYYDLGSTSSWTKTGGYSVSDTKKVMFTTGNLYWDGSDYHIESTQTGSSRDASLNPTIDYIHLSYFYWANTKDYKTSGMEPYAKQYSCSAQSTTDKFWCGTENRLTVDGTENLYVLANDEWMYLIKSRTNADNLYKYGVTVTDGNGNSYADCLVIAPDNFDYTNYALKSSYTLEEINYLCLTCLPNVSCTYETASGKNFYTDEKDYACYWSSTPYEEESLKEDAYNFCWSSKYNWYSTEIGWSYEMRKFGQCIRLVYTYPDPTK